MSDSVDQRQGVYERYVPRWLRGVVSWLIWPVVATLIFLSVMDKRSASHYQIPRLEETLHVTGVLKPVSGGRRSDQAPVTIQAGNREVHLGCNPNFRYTIGCMPRELRKALSGKTVSVRYFYYDDARRFKNVLLQLEADGQVITHYDDRAEYLIRQRESDRRNPTGGSVAFGVVGGLIITVCQKIGHWIRRRSSRVPKT